MPGGWRFEWIVDWDAVWSRPFLDQWQLMLESSSNPHVFYEPPLVRSWLETFSQIQDMSPRFVLAHDNCGRNALLPLLSVRSRWKDAWRRTLSPVGQPGFDYRDPIFVGTVDQPAWTDFWAGLDDELQRRWKGTFDTAAVYHLRAAGCWDSRPLVDTTEAILPPRPEDVAPRVHLKGFQNLDDYLATRSPKFRRGLQSKIRHLQERGHLEHRVFSESEVGAVLNDLPEVLLVNRSRWPMTWRAKGYYENLVRHAMPPGLLHYSRLELDGVAISWHLGFRYRGQLSGYLSAFRGEFQALSPGRVHVAFAIRDAIAQGMSTFDFMLGNEPYKLEWADSAVQLYAFRRSGSGPMSAARNLWSERAKPHLVRARRAMTRFAQKASTSPRSPDDRVDARPMLAANETVSGRAQG